jgi:hypothetical protein
MRTGREAPARGRAAGAEVDIAVASGEAGGDGWYGVVVVVLDLRPWQNQ